MKIVATVDSNTVLLEATQGELKNLFGSYRYDSKVKDFTPGTTLEVHPMYDQLMALAESKQEMVNIARDLRKVADKFDKNFNPIIVPEVIKSSRS